jgi:hypothetical protein
MMELRGLADRVPTIQHTSALQVSFGVGSERRSARQLVELSEKGGVNSEADSQRPEPELGLPNCARPSSVFVTEPPAAVAAQ